MKKEVLLLLSILFPLACTRVAEPLTPDGLLLKATAEEPVASRSTLSDEGLFAWSENDNLTVLSADGARGDFSLVSGAGTASAVFSGTLSGAPALAFTPAGAHTATQFVLPEEYGWDGENTFAPMRAEASGNDLAFKHLGGVMKLVFTEAPDDAVALAVSAPGQRLTGAFDLQASPDGQVQIATAPTEAADSTLRIRFAAEDCTVPMVFYVPLPVGSYPVLSVCFEDENGFQTGEVYRAHGNTVSRGTLLLMPQRGPSLLEGRLVRASSSTLSFHFSSTRFKDIAADCIHPYEVALYRDEACEQLVVSWQLKARFFNAVFRAPGFIFSGLAPDTDYYFRFRETGSETWSPVVAGHTDPFTVVVPGTTPAAIGDVVLAEDFSELVWGGSLLGGERCAGYQSTKASSVKAITPALGENPVNDATFKYAVTDCTTEIALYTTLGTGIGSTRLNAWGNTSESGTAQSAVILGRPGCLKLGASSLCGSIATPELTNLPTGNNILRVVFRAQPYYEAGMDDNNGMLADPYRMQINVISNSVLKSSHRLDYDVADCVEAVSFDLEPGNTLREYTIDIHDVPSGSRLSFGGDPAHRTDNGGKNLRLYLEQVRVYLLGNENVDLGYVNGTKIQPGMTGYGLVSDAATGAGIPGVPITDGYTYTTTDENGVYQFILDGRCRCIYPSWPAGYKIPVQAGAPSIPAFYKDSVNPLMYNRVDFTLEPLDAPEDNFSLVAIGDPQCKTDSNVKRYRTETIPDIETVLAAEQAAGRYPNAYGLTLGDITYDNTAQWDPMVSTMSDVRVAGDPLTIFQCIGNHDHNAAWPTDYEATLSYTLRFGPTDYSFNRGQAHIVVMDDIFGIKAGSNTWSYQGGFTDDQYAWLKADLDLVEDKENKLVIFAAHIPFRGGVTAGGGSVNFSHHYDDVMALLTQFHEAHMLIGHTHHPVNYIHTKWVCKGGQPVYEHIHGAACGAWWNNNLNTDGAPNGYSLYEIRGNSMYNWIAWNTGEYFAGRQMLVFDGNHVYGTAHRYSWTAGGQRGSIVVNGHAELAGCFIAFVWNDERYNWKVEFIDADGVAHPMTRISYAMSNISSCAHFYDVIGRGTDSYKVASDHFWLYKAPSGLPSSERGWKIRATQTIPSSGVVNVYEEDSIQADFTGY